MGLPIGQTGLWHKDWNSLSYHSRIGSKQQLLVNILYLTSELLKSSFGTFIRAPPSDIASCTGTVLTNTDLPVAGTIPTLLLEVFPYQACHSRHKIAPSKLESTRHRHLLQLHLQCFNSFSSRKKPRATPGGRTALQYSASKLKKAQLAFELDCFVWIGAKGTLKAILHSRNSRKETKI